MLTSIGAAMRLISLVLMPTKRSWPTPEFWEAWTRESLTIPAVEREAVASSLIHAPSRSSVRENPEDLQKFGQSSANRSHLDDKAQKMIGSDLAPLSSAFNPTEIRVNKGWCLDTAEGDTETNLTQEVQKASHRTAPATKGKADGSSPVLASSRSPICEGPADLQPCKLPTTNPSHLDDESLEVTESSFDLLENCSKLGVSGWRNVANSQAGKVGQQLFAAMMLIFFFKIGSKA
jgi:hypothetical protein